MPQNFLFLNLKQQFRSSKSEKQLGSLLSQTPCSQRKVFETFNAVEKLGFEDMFFYDCTGESFNFSPPK